MPFRSTIPYIPQRWVVCILCSWAFAIISFKKACFYDIATIVHMFTDINTIPSGGCPFLFSDDSWYRLELPFFLPDFYWNPQIVELAQSAYYAGKTLTAVPAGVLSDLGYSKYVLGGGMFTMAVCHLILPTFSDVGVILYIVENFFDGVGSASIYPSVISLISRWTRPSELNIFTALVVAGLFYGNILGHGFFNLIYMGLSSWSVGQYTTGIIGLVWLSLWFVFIYHSPEESPFVSDHEVHAITDNRRRSLIIGVQRLQGIPWRRIVSSRPFLSLVLAFCSLEWATDMNIYGTIVPYEQYILHLPEKFSKVSSTMIIAVLPTLLMGSLFVDYVLKDNCISKKVVKRSFVFISVTCSSVLMIAATLTGCNILMFWVLTVTALFTLGLEVSVVFSAPVDLCPRYAGLLFGIMTCSRTICALFRERIREYLVPDIYNQDHWRKKVLCSVILTCATAAPFLFLGSGEPEDWRSRNSDVPAVRPPVELQTVDEQIPRQFAG